MDEVKPAARLPTVEHREPCESRGSRTVLGAPGGEIPPGDSSLTSDLIMDGRCRFRSEADMQMVVQGNHIYADDPSLPFGMTIFGSAQNKST